MKNMVEVDAPVCTEHELHRDVLSRAFIRMPKTETTYDLADFFKVLGDSTRLGILFALDKEPMCVCDVAELLGMTKSAVSHQLKILRQNDLVRYRRDGKNVIYTLADDHVKDIIECAFEHLNEEEK